VIVCLVFAHAAMQRNPLIAPYVTILERHLPAGARRPHAQSTPPDPTRLRQRRVGRCELISRRSQTVVDRNAKTGKNVKVAHTYSITELIPVLGRQPAGDVSHKPGGRLPLLSARLAVTPATLKRAAANFAAW